MQLFPPDLNKKVLLSEDARERERAVSYTHLLLRLRDAAGSFISPAEFIPVAEETGLIVDVGYLVLDTVCRQLLSMASVAGLPFQIAVNISAIQLLQTNFVSRVVEIIQYHGINPQQLEFRCV